MLAINVCKISNLSPNTLETDFLDHIFPNLVWRCARSQHLKYSNITFLSSNISRLFFQFSFKHKFGLVCTLWDLQISGHVLFSMIQLLVSKLADDVGEFYTIRRGAVMSYDYLLCHGSFLIRDITESIHWRQITGWQILDVFLETNSETVLIVSGPCLLYDVW